MSARTHYRSFTIGVLAIMFLLSFATVPSSIAGKYPALTVTEYYLGDEGGEAVPYAPGVSAFIWAHIVNYGDGPAHRFQVEFYWENKVLITDVPILREFSETWIRSPSSVILEGGDYKLRIFVTDTKIEMWDLQMEDNEFMTNVHISSRGISCNLQPEKLISGSSTIIGGKVIPENPPATVTIEFRPKGEGTWRRLATVQADLKGEFSYRWAPESIGLYEIRSLLPLDSITPSLAYSLVKTLRVVAQVAIDLRVDPPVIPQGGTINLSGRLSQPVEEGTVTVIYGMPNGETFEKAVDITPKGEFQDTFRPSMSDKWSAQIRWRGDVLHEPATSPTIFFEVQKTSHVEISTNTIQIPPPENNTASWLTVGVVAVLIGLAVLIRRLRGSNQP